MATQRISTDRKVDNGWRFFSDIESAILAIYNMPIGSDLQLVIEDGKIKFYDNLTKEKILLGYK